MANKADELLKKGKTVLLAFEEAIGNAVIKTIISIFYRKAKYL